MLVMPTRVSEQRIYDNGVTGFPKEMHLARVSRTMRASKESHGFTSRVQDFSDARSRGIETTSVQVCARSDQNGHRYGEECQHQPMRPPTVLAFCCIRLRLHRPLKVCI